MIDKAHIKSFARYTVVGVVSTLVQFIVLMFFVEFLHLNSTFSSASGFSIGCLVHYLLLYYWTFKATGRHRDVVIRYIIVTLFTLMLNISVFWFLTEVMHLWYMFSQVFAVVAVALINYLSNRNYTFN